MKCLDVAVALVVREGQVLIAQRGMNAQHGAMWEFPGGKIEDGESSGQAVQRELIEEVGLEAESTELLGLIEHNYGRWAVRLHVHRVDAFHGEAKMKEQQMALRWVDTSILSNFPFPKANQAIIHWLCDEHSSPSCGESVRNVAVL